MVCVITAARAGKHVLLLEKNPKLGKKILYTGNGRCNITNAHVVEDQRGPVHYHGSHPKFVIPALNAFSLEKTKHFFDELGIEFVEEADGRFFPSSNQAQSVVDVLKFELERLDVEIKLETEVKSAKYNKTRKLFEVDSSAGKYSAPKLVIACGGKSYPKFGSTGDGYTLAKSFEHTVTPTFPAYVALVVDSPLCKELQGTKVEVVAKVIVDGKQVAENSGTMMFAHFGLSAPAILELSRLISEQINVNHKKVSLKVNFLPNIKRDKLEEFIISRWSKCPHKSLGFSFVGLLPQKLFPAMLEANSIDTEIKCSQVDKKTRSKIVELLSGYEFEVGGVRGFDESHFTAGGVNVKEVNPNTMESTMQSNLYFTGEVLDIDGDCGGYNLQWAWSSGYVAGINI